MAGRVCALILSVGLMDVVSASVNPRSYDGFSSVGLRLEVHGSSVYNHGHPGHRRDLERKRILGEGLSHASETVPPNDGITPEPGQPVPRRGKWCSVVRSRVITYVDLCRTEKYVIRSQLPCPNGTPDCQKILYRLAQKPVYEIKRKAVTGLDWRCCPGFIGTTCELTDPNSIQIPAEFSAQPETDQQHAINLPEVSEIIQEIQSQETLLENIQNDIHQASGNLLDLHNALENNVTMTPNHTNLGVEDRILREVFLPHVENFLKEHFHPMFNSFNKSLQSLSFMVRNLSENVETNKIRLDKFLENTVPKKDLQELGSKFESKIEENMVKIEQMRHEMDRELHAQQAGIHHNLTMIKTETDVKLKRNQKLQQAQFLQLNLSISELRRDQEQFQDDLQDVTQNMTELRESCGPRGGETNQHINETLAEHERQLKDLYTESDAAFENISTLEKWFKELRTDFRKNADEVQVSFMEKSLIMEENKDFLLKQLMELNYTIAGIQESADELFRNCDCQKMTLDILSLEEAQKNFSNLYKDVLYGIEDVRQKEGSSKTSLQNSFEDLSLALQLNRLSLTAQQEQGRNLMNLTSRLQSEARAFADDVDLLKRDNDKIHDHIKLLDSSFLSLLQDATRHDRALEALLGDDLLEEFSEDTSEALQMTILQMYQVLNETQNRLEKQQQTTDSLADRVHYLETQPRNPSPPGSSTIFNVEQGTEGVTNDGPLKRRSLAHMEPSHEASRDDDDEATNGDIAILKNDIKHLSGTMKRLESYFTDGNYFNDTILSALKPLNVSVGSMKSEIVALRGLFDGHLRSFKKIFGNYEPLISSDTPLDLVKVQAIVDRKMRKKQKGEEPTPKKSDRRWQSDGTAEVTPKQGTSVAFSAAFKDGAEGVKILRFTDILLNYGDVFSAEDEHFTAPATGVYAFTIAVDFGPGSALGHLVFGGREKLSLYSSAPHQGESVRHSFAMVELHKGDKVWFELLHGSIKKNSFGTVLAGYLVFKT